MAMIDQCHGLSNTEIIARGTQRSHIIVWCLLVGTQHSHITGWRYVEKMLTLCTTSAGFDARIMPGHACICGTASTVISLNHTAFLIHVPYIDIRSHRRN
jgi:hypothetical protein